MTVVQTSVAAPPENPEPAQPPPSMAPEAIASPPNPLAGDPAFYRKVLAEDWTRGDSDGTYYTKAGLLNLMADAKNIKTNSEKLSELKVRAYGDTAVATYKDTYDILIMGQRRAHTIIATDTFVKIDGEWKQVASHGAEVKK